MSSASVHHYCPQCVEEKCGILNATVTQRTKFMELIELEPSVQVNQQLGSSLKSHCWQGVGCSRVPK